MLTLLVRTLIVFVMVIISVRLMGKRQVGQLQVPELVVMMIISQLATAPLADTEQPLWRAAAPIALLVLCEVGMSALTLASPQVNKLLYGSPSFLMNQGKIDRDEMRRQRVTAEDLCEQLRRAGERDLGRVSCMVLETNGQMSVIMKPQFAAATAADVGVVPPDRGLPAVVVCDGKPNANGLKFYGRDENWLRERLKKENLRIEEVFFMSLDSADGIFVIRQSDIK